VKIDRDNLIYEVARELGISKEIVTFVINDFWDSISYYLRNPLSHGKFLLINYFGKFYVNTYTVGLKLERMKKKRPHSRYIAVYEKMLENGKRQASQTDDNE
jgi:nucleoid DNA-binding protein